MLTVIWAWNYVLGCLLKFFTPLYLHVQFDPSSRCRSLGQDVQLLDTERHRTSLPLARHSSYETRIGVSSSSVLIYTRH